MKIARAVRTLYDECAPLYERLAKDVTSLLKPKVEQNQWFFLSRVKQLESFALKLETGRVENPRRSEDFFACTIVVRTLSEIDDAERLITSLYPLKERRPPNNGQTTKSAHNFFFDDLRLYVEQPESTTGRDTDLEGIMFEVQIKTILQHAWGVATHDLIYKSDRVSWPRERIAYQVKAMLEHAEIAIAEAERLADAPAVAKTDPRTADTAILLNSLNRIWSADQLPTDRKRLADTILQVLKMCGKTADQFTEVVDTEKMRIGLLPADLSPYAFTIQALANSSDVPFQQQLTNPRNRTHILIHDNMDLPIWMQSPHPKIIRA